MSNIPQEIKDKIRAASKENFPAPKPGDFPDDLILDMAAQQGAKSGAFRFAAEFGYSIAQEELEASAKEITILNKALQLANERNRELENLREEVNVLNVKFDKCHLSREGLKQELEAANEKVQELVEGLKYITEGVCNLPPLTAIAGTLTNQYEKAKQLIAKYDNP